MDWSAANRAAVKMIPDVEVKVVFPLNRSIEHIIQDYASVFVSI
jgi:hypothetical protein